MNNKYLFKLSYLLIIIFVFSFCSKKKKASKEETKPETKISSKEKSFEEEVQAKLEDMVYSGYGYKQIRPPKWQRLQWIKNHIEDFREIADSLPDDFIIVLKGHADGNKSAEDEQTISQWNIGHLRANFLSRLLRVNKVDEEKLKLASAADDEPAEGASKSDPKNRRVTLHIERR